MAVFFSCLKKSNDKLNFTDEPDNKLTSLTEIIIEKTWAQQPNGYVYPIDIKVPESIEPLKDFQYVYYSILTEVTVEELSINFLLF